MTSPVDGIEHEGALLALIVPDGYSRPGDVSSRPAISRTSLPPYASADKVIPGQNSTGIRQTYWRAMCPGRMFKFGRGSLQLHHGLGVTGQRVLPHSNGTASPSAINTLPTSRPFAFKVPQRRPWLQRCVPNVPDRQEHLTNSKSRLLLLIIS